MKSNLALSVLLFWSIGLFSQVFNINWQNCFGGTENESIKDIVRVDSGYLILGHTRSIDGDISNNHGGSDVWIIKTDLSGNMIWEKCYGGTDHDGAFSIHEAPDGNFFIAGGSTSSDGDISYDPYPNSGDYWILKIDEDGAIIWDKIIGSTGANVPYASDLINDGGIVITGWSLMNDGDMTNWYGSWDMWMVKLDKDGNLEWDFTLGGAGLDFSQTIQQTSDGGFLVGGTALVEPGGNLSCDMYEEPDIVIVKLDSSRNIEWQNCYGGNDIDGVTNLMELSDGYLFAGYTSSDDGDITGWHGMHDIWVVKIDFNGNIIWQRCLGGSGDESVEEMMLMDDSSIMIFGGTSSFDGDVSGNHSHPQSGDNDVWMARLSIDGNFLWQQCIGGLRNEYVCGVSKESEHNFVLAATTDNSTYDVNCELQPGYSSDYWVFKIEESPAGMIENGYLKVQLDVYPNPADDYVRFDYELNSAIKNPKLKIFNLQGVELAEIPLKSTTGTEIWNCRSVAPGMYFYQISQEGRSISKGKILIRR